MRLVIVESPTKSKTIQKFLGPSYRILSSYGHIRDLPRGEFGIDIKHSFAPKYVIPQGARKTVNLLKKEAYNADIVILATDEDREGEAIAWHLVQALGLTTNAFRYQKSKIKNQNIHPLPPFQRIVFHEITKSAIEEALKHPRGINMNLVNAQQARRILDRIVGYKLSPFLWKKIARGLSAGRVQSVAVRLVTEREEERRTFVPKEYWTIEALLEKYQKSQKNKSLKNNFTAMLLEADGKSIGKFAIASKEDAAKIMKNLENAEYKVSHVEQKEMQRNPLPPFTTSTLQQEAWRRFRFSAKLTMQIAQKLYETGRITYHRTDSLNLSQPSLSAAKKFIIEKYGKTYWAGFFRKYKTKSKGAQEAHEAIRPTHPDLMPEKIKLEKNQMRVYELIWKRFIACQMKEAIFDSTRVDISASKYIFRANGQILKFDGFLKVYPITFEEKELPPLQKGEILKLIRLVPSQHFTQPPPRYTEASLIKTMEEYGIGRPSTYAPILSAIQERGYVEKDEKKALFPTELGETVHTLLITHFPSIVDIQFTAKMEEELDEIARGRKQWTSVVKKFYTPFAKTLEQKYAEVSKKDFTETPTEKLCPACGSPLVIRFGKYGKFYACSSFPKCNYTESLQKQKNIAIQCPKCKEGTIAEKRTQKGKLFYGCNRYPECDFALWEKPTGENCKKCGSPLIVTKRTIQKCSNKNCK